MSGKGRAAILTAVCVAAFGGGLLAGYVKNRPEKEETVRAEENVRSEEETPTFVQTGKTEGTSEAAERKLEYYIIRADGGDIVVTEIYSDGTTEETERTEFEYEMLRKDDRELLEEGIKVFSREEAMSRMEDFIS